MEKQLYPLKFEPIIKNTIWGGSRLKTHLNKKSCTELCGESWEISGVDGNVSVASNGFLKDNDILELVEVYMGDLVGDKVYEKFGDQFPLLIKYIDANDALSIQVHPDDKLAKERHNSFGKTEMWYVMQADKDSNLIVGFNQPVTKDLYLQKLEEKNLVSVLNEEKVESGDAFFIPAGRVHAIGSGILLAEIQQTSNLTYRIYDFDRKDKDGNTRELHTELALDAIDFTHHTEYKTNYIGKPNESSSIVNSQYFTTNVIKLDKTIEKDYINIDSFVIYMIVEGEIEIETNNEVTNCKMGETILIPAALNQLHLKPKTPLAKVLEVYINL